MPRQKKNLGKLKKLERAVVNQSRKVVSEDEMDELEEESDEELKEPQSVHEGMGIEKEENEEGEPFIDNLKSPESEKVKDESDEDEDDE